MKHNMIAAACLISAVLLSGCIQATEVPETTAVSTAPVEVTEEAAETAAPPTTVENTEATEATALEASATEETACAHKYQFKVTKEPTCSASGERVYTCTLCGASYKEVIEPLAHSYVKTAKAPDCVNSGYTTYRCKECQNTYTDNYQPPLGHNYGPWIIEEEPTAFRTGLSTCTCKRCGARETMVLPRLTSNTP